ncbi:hypothetical protein BRADI_3g14662v3 [Brachypodium distachyon]|uniref:Phytocyanin domain-containing protein n=1 Tax=Brachypodium distachyon TaxID=15368 RepID=A0A0Q3LR41_BRADI|nr:hypothetical protein BRADI_3g14662v3 [Brachypodium distachyon]
MAIYKLFLIIVASALLFSMALGASYTVGAPAGSCDLKTNYTQWASARRFFPGDSLRFQYPTATHNVLEVTKAAYDSCNISVSVIATVTRYFMCGILGHCADGMKLKVNVGAQPQMQCWGRGKGARQIRCTQPAPASPEESSAIGGGAARSSMWLAAVMAAGLSLLCF